LHGSANRARIRPPIIFPQGLGYPGTAVRAFVAIPLPDPLGKRLAAYAADALAGLDGRAVPAENLHATVHFLGAVDEANTESLRAVLAEACASVSPFSMRLADAALAPPSRPRMIWARLEAPGKLAELAQVVATAADPFAPSARPPRTGKPHLTIARLRRRPPRGTELPPFGDTGSEIHVDACTLVRSDLGRGGARYTTLAELSLGPS
jgi:2'-5' RNA ligase